MELSIVVGPKNGWPGARGGRKGRSQGQSQGRGRFEAICQVEINPQTLINVDKRWKYRGLKLQNLGLERPEIFPPWQQPNG